MVEKSLSSWELFKWQAKWKDERDRVVVHIHGYVKQDHDTNLPDKMGDVTPVLLVAPIHRIVCSFRKLSHLTKYLIYNILTLAKERLLAERSQFNSIIPCKLSK